MKLVIAIIQPYKLEAVKEELYRAVSFSRAQDYRVFTGDTKESLRYDLSLGVPNRNLFSGLAYASGEEAFNTRRGTKFFGDKKIFQTLPVVSMMNVKYIIFSFELPLPLKKVFETTATKYNIPVYIYENPEVLPRVYFAKNIVYTAETNEDKLFEQLLTIFDFKENTLIECGDDSYFVDSNRVPTCNGSPSWNHLQ